MDALPPGYTYGQCKRQPLLSLLAGEDVAKAVFVSAHPRNARVETFLKVEKWDADKEKWSTVATDADPSTVFLWRPVFLAESEAVISWKIPRGQQPGTYRLAHQGFYRTLGRRPDKPFVGYTRPFEVNIK